MISTVDLIKKIHHGGETIPGDKYDHICYTAILRDWRDSLSLKSLIDVEINQSSTFYDQMYSYEKLLDKVQSLSDEGCEDTYFSINSFWKPDKSTTEIRHLNAFALDFDFYKKKHYKKLSPNEFYEALKPELPFPPTAVVDSGRGLYVIYCFNHCSKERLNLYKAVYRRFSALFKNHGMDEAATNVTQVIRLPGTCNSRCLRDVEILEFNDTNYELTDFASILEFTQDQVNEYKKTKCKVLEQKKNETIEQSNARKIKRTTFFKKLLDDFKLLISLRNQSKNYEGYRECLIYLLRERATWSGLTINESVDEAKKINEMFHYPLSNLEVEKQCRPSQMRKCSSVKTMIRKLDITTEEQMKLKILKSKKLKDSLFSKRSKKHKLLNRTKKELDMLERRTKVFHLKNAGIKNKDISDILEVNKSTITKDLKYIQENKKEFRIDLSEAINAIASIMEAPELLRSVTYDIQQKLLKWLEMSPSALELSG